MLKERVEATNAAKSELAKDDKLTAFRKLDAGSFADKQFVLMNLVHASDISNPCLRYDLYINWSVILAQEFNEQVSLKVYGQDPEGSGKRLACDGHVPVQRRSRFLRGAGVFPKYDSDES